MISTRSAGLLIDTVVCLTLAKWETVSGRFGGYLRTRFLSCRCRPPSHVRLRPGARGSFFKILDRARGLRVMARPCGELAIAHGAQLPAERLLGDRDAELLEDPLCQIDQPPTHHAVDCRNRPTLDHAGDGLALDVVELGRLPRRLSVQQTVRAPLVEVQHPISDDLKPDTANHRRLSTRRAIINCGERQKPTGLRAVFRLLRQTTQLGRTKISAQWYRSRHDEPPAFAMLNQTRAHPGIARESKFQRPGVKWFVVVTGTELSARSWFFPTSGAPASSSWPLRSARAGGNTGLPRGRPITTILLSLVLLLLG